MSEAQRIPVALIGGGEHARVVADAILSRRQSFDLRGFFDPAACEETIARFAILRLGDDSALVHHPGLRLVLGVGQLRVTDVREKMIERLAVAADWVAIVHADAWVSPTATVEPGAVIMAGAVVQTGARVGAHCVVNTGAVIEHDVKLGPFVNVGPRAAIGGGTQIGASSMVGLGASVRDHLQIGSRAMIAMGAVVVRDVADGEYVKGIAAK